MAIFCGEGKITEIEGLEHQAAFDNLVEIYNGNEDAAARKYYQMFRSDEDQRLLQVMNEGPAGAKLVPGFNATQQRSIVKTIERRINKGLNAGETDLGRLKSGVTNILKRDRDLFKREIKDIRERQDLTQEEKEKKISGKQYRVNELNKILENFNLFWSFAQQDLESIGLNVSDDGIVQEPGSDYVRKNWDDYARFYIDPKNTASEKIKRFLSFIPKKEFDIDSDGNVRTENGRRKVKSVSNYLGYKEYANMDDIFERLGEIMSDTVPPDSVDSKFDFLLNKLREKNDNPQIKEVVDRLDASDNEALQNAFVNAFAKSYDNETLVMFKPQTDSDGEIVAHTLVALDSNRNSQVERVKREWFENQKILPLTRQGQDNKLEVDVERVQKIKDNYLSELRDKAGDTNFKTYINANENEFLTLLQNTLSDLGIEVPFSALKEIKSNPKSLSDSGSFLSHVAPVGNNNTLSDKHLLGIIFSRFEGQEGQEENINELQKYSKLGTNNPIYGKDDQGIITNLARVSADHLPRVYSPSFMNVKNNQIHSIQDHTALTREFATLMQNPENATSNRGAYDGARFGKDDQVSTSMLLQAIEENTANTRNIIGLEYLDGMKRFSRGRGTTHQDMGTVDKHLTRVSLFQAAQRNDRIKMLSPTLSDKSRDYIMTLPPVYKMVGNQVQGNPKNWMHNSGLEITSDGDLTNISNSSVPIQVLSRIVFGEQQRIAELQKSIQNDGYDTHPLGEDYQEYGQKFFMFPELNPENLTESETKRLWSDVSNQSGKIEWRLKTTSDAFQFIQEKLKTRLRAETNRVKNKWKELGLLREDGPDLLDSTYMKNTPFGKQSERGRTYAAMDFALSNMFFNSEITKLLSGDPALHTKVPSADANPNEVVTETFVNLQKRQANHIAPAITNALSGTANVVTLDDRVVDSKQLKEYRGVLGEKTAEAYTDIEAADAQEYTTMREHVNMMFAHENITKDLRDKIIDKIDEVQADPDNTNNYYKLSNFLSEEEMSQLNILAHKPVIVSRKYHENLGASGTSAWFYRKSSSFPLLPELTQDMDIDNLRVAAENSDVDRLAFQTADKTGAYNPIDPFKSDNRTTFQDAEEIEAKLNKKGKVDQPADATIQKIGRRDIGLQFELPQKPPGITTLTQLNKNVTLGAKNVSGFDWKGEEKTGREMEEIRQELRVEMFETARDQFFDDFGIEATINEDMGLVDAKVVDNQKLQEVLLREAEERNWSPSAIDSLQLDEQNRFPIPFSFSPGAKSIESLLLSVIKDRVIDKDLYGKNYVQASVTGFHATGNNTGVVFTEDYSAEEGLSHLRVDDDGNTQATEVFVPWSFTDENGQLLNMEDYTKEIEDEDGNTRKVIDDDMLDPALREGISARVPNQGPSSTMPIKIKGFLPSSFDKLMVVTEETVTQMGSDFDVDKLFSYLSKPIYDSETGELRKALEEDFQSDSNNLSKMDRLKQEYKDLLWSMMTNPNQVDRVLTPLDLPHLGNEADTIQETLSDDSAVKNYLSPVTHVEDHNNQQAGKDLIGIFSNFSTLNAILEMYPQEMEAQRVDADMVFQYRNREGEIRELSQIGGADISVEIRDAEDVTIPEIIMMYQNGAVDNAKELILDKLNATTDTAPIMGTLMMLNDGSQALPLETLTRLFVQESIQNFQSELDAIRSQTNDEFVEDANELALERVRQEILDNFSEEDQEYIQNQADTSRNVFNEDGDIEKRVAGTIPKPQQLQDDLESGNIRDNRDYAARQLQYLELYEKLHNVNKGVQSIQGIANFGDRNGAGPSLVHAQEKSENLDTMWEGGNLVFKNPQEILEGTEWGSTAENSYKLAWTLFKDKFGYNEGIFKSIRDKYKRLQGEDVNPDKVLDIFREMKSFVFSTNDMWTNAEGERSRLLFGNESVEDIATRVKKAQNSWGSNDFFIQRLRPQIPEEAGEPASVNFSNEKAERMDSKRIMHSIAGLLTNKNSEKRVLMEDLVKYTYLAAGSEQNPNSFMQHIPLNYLIEFGLADAINNFDFGDVGNTESELSPSKNFIDQYFQHNPSDAKVLDREFVNDNIRSGDKMPPVIKSSIQMDELTYETTNGKELVPYVSIYDDNNFQWKLYKAGEDGNSHYEIDTLGGDNIKEYQAGSSKLLQSSHFEENQSEFTDGNPWDESKEKTQSDDQVEATNVRKDRPDTLVTDLTKNGDSYTVGEMLDNIKDISENSFHIKLARLLNQEQFSDLTIEVNDQIPGAARAYSNRDVIHISQTDSRTVEENHEKIFHELIHKVVFNLKDKPKNELTSDQEEVLTNLNNIFKKAQTTIKNKFGRKKWEETTNKINEARETGDNIQLDADEILIYSVTNFDEFLAHALTDKTVQKELNNIDGVSEKSVLENIIDSIKDLFISLGESVGMNLNRDSALTEIIGNSVRLIEAESKNRPDNSQMEIFQETEETVEGETVGDDVSLQDLMDKTNESFDTESMNQTLGEFRSSLSDVNKEMFDRLRTRIITKC